MTYGDHEPTLPYETDYFSDWAQRHGINQNSFEGFKSVGSFLVARLRSQEVAQELLLSHEIEALLPLQGAVLVDSPVQEYLLRETAAGDSSVDQSVLVNRALGTEHQPPKRPKEFLAPEGMAFKITIQPEAFAWDYDDDEELEAYSFIGEYLRVKTWTDTQGDSTAEVVVRGNVSANLAHAILGVGNAFNGPSKEDMIQLRSPTDPKRGGPSVAFVRYSEPIVAIHSQKHSAPFDLCEVELVPYVRSKETEFYNPPFSEPEGIPLDAFDFYPEEESTPHGFVRVPVRGGGTAVFHHPTSFMALPHIDGRLNNEFYDDHHIMLKWTSATDNTIINLEFDRLDGLDYQLRRYNSLLACNYLFQRYFVVRDPGTGISLSALIKSVQDQHYLTSDELERELQIRRR